MLWVYPSVNVEGWNSRRDPTLLPLLYLRFAWVGEETVQSAYDIWSSNWKYSV